MDIIAHYDVRSGLIVVKQGSKVIAKMDFNQLTPYQNLAITFDVLKENLPNTNSNQKEHDVKAIHYICKAMKILSDGTLNIIYR